MVGPDYQRPAIELPTAYPGAAAERRSPSPRRRADWWTLFDDPELNGLVATALANNTDVQRAVARIEEADANLRAVNATLFPEIDLNGAAVRTALELRGGLAAVARHAERQERHSPGVLGFVRDRLLGQAAPRRGGRARAGAGLALREGRGDAVAGEPHHADLLLAALARRADRDHAQYARHAQRRARARQASRRRGLRVRPRSAPGGRRARRMRRRSSRN